MSAPAFFPVISMGEMFVLGGAYYEGDFGYDLRLHQFVRPSGVTLVGLTGTYQDIDEPAGYPDGNWLVVS